jgi:oligopeptide transport system ATP-binding protein
MGKNELLRIENLRKQFNSKGKDALPVKAVDSVSFSIDRGETFGLVGESGSGKTTLGRTILRLTEPDSGKIIFDGKDITKADMKPYRKRMQIVFQNSAGSLDPKMRVENIIAEGIHAGDFKGTKSELKDKVAELLISVGLTADDMYRYPGEFSGGQQQRIGIARAIAVEPEFIVCDEPVSALDVSYQSQIINLLEELQEKMGLTYLFISHDLSVVMHISQRVGVMYLGELVEVGTKEDIVLNTAHPYTTSLMMAIPVPDPKLSHQRVRNSMHIEPISSMSKIQGCKFYPRCDRATSQCEKVAPKLKEISKGHFCACHLI